MIARATLRTSSSGRGGRICSAMATTVEDAADDSGDRHSVVLPCLRQALARLVVGVLLHGGGDERSLRNDRASLRILREHQPVRVDYGQAICSKGINGGRDMQARRTPKVLGALIVKTDAIRDDDQLACRRRSSRGVHLRWRFLACCRHNRDRIGLSRIDCRRADGGRIVGRCRGCPVANVAQHRASHAATTHEHERRCHSDRNDSGGGQFAAKRLWRRCRWLAHISSDC